MNYLQERNRTTQDTVPELLPLARQSRSQTWRKWRVASDKWQAKKSSRREKKFAISSPARSWAATKLNSPWPPCFKDLNTEDTERLSELRVQSFAGMERTETRLPIPPSRAKKSSPLEKKLTASVTEPNWKVSLQKAAAPPAESVSARYSQTWKNKPATPLMVTPLVAWRKLCARTGGGIALPTLYRWIGNGRLGSIRMGKKILIPVTALDELILQCLRGEVS